MLGDIFRDTEQPSLPNVSALSRQQAGAKDEEPNAAAACAVLCCVLPLTVGISAGMGAAAGSLGYQTLRNTQGYTVPEISYDQSVQLMAAGCAVMTAVLSCCGGVLTKEQQKSLILIGIVAVAIGALDGLLGGAMLNLIQGKPEAIGYSAAMGATGVGVLTAILIAIMLPLMCCLACLKACADGQNRSRHELGIPEWFQPKTGQMVTSFKSSQAAAALPLSEATNAGLTIRPMMPPLALAMVSNPRCVAI